MKIIKNFAVSVMSLSLCVGILHAAQPGAYIGLGVGPSRVDTPDSDLFPDGDDQTAKIGGIGGRIFVGYNFSEYLGIEMGYAKYAQSTYSATYYDYWSDTKVEVTAEGSAVDVIAKTYLPLGESRFNFYALGGLAHMVERVTAKSTDSSGYAVDSTLTASGVRLKYGVGLSYDTDRKVSVGLELSRINGSDTSENGINNMDNLDMLSLNLSYRFG